MKKIKVLKDTPFNMKDDVISVKEYREKYKYSIVDVVVPDEEILEYIQHERDVVRNNPVTISKKPFMGEFFEVVEIQDHFKAGDWVWNKKTQEAHLLIKYEGLEQDMWPNHATIEAANQYTDIWKRKATEEEIKEAVLHYFPIDRYPVLVGRNRVFVKDNVWKEVKNAKRLLALIKRKGFYLTAENVKVGERTFEPFIAGIKLGCVTIGDHIIKKIMNIMEV
jgi:hypothetical protein